MDGIINLLDWADWLATPLADLLLSASSGLLTSLVIWIIFYALLRKWGYSIRLVLSSGAGFGMVLCAVLGGVSAVLFVHAALDGYAVWYTMPLDPPLELVLP